jgi:hypothetical protein
MVSDSKLGAFHARGGVSGQHDQAVVVALGVDFHAGVVVAGDGLVFLGIALVELHGRKRYINSKRSIIVAF